MTIQFGDTVEIHSGAYYTLLGRRHSAELADVVGATAVVVGGPDDDGDYELHIDNHGTENVAGSALRVLESPERDC